ncbi:DUF58 domain-containing protein [Flammeovirga kamogawensis]|uniref:DUF58 domain-containing protein n=1 Tax=Flammeovirga kamogawensis TaxID=373891 RepID=A0ABX8GZV6_9BACT|nr:DUF58 domain-containing protein [Flammeovirga kamogawensis]MBB6459323.1 uncharacterized protein (DUF58 family) [Flammeovirga kamogawensis]QWG08882.1 DUF58 domain-containing protein [Flammeovirga kamogawensis]TRX67172.1 DUF58 domain-containing protein [Flammeovirga kamogawensis]
MSSSDLHISIQDLLELEGITEGTEFFKHQRVAGLLSGRHASMLRGRGLDFSEVRKYVMGDDIRNIDWKVTARTRETHTKVFSEEKERPQMVILDQSLAMLFGSSHQLKANIAIQMMAIHGFRALKMGDRFGGIIYNDEKTLMFRPSRSKTLFQALLEESLQLNHALISQKVKKNTKSDKINEALFQMLQIATHDYIINVITDATLLDEIGIERLGTLAQSNNVIVTHIYDPLDEKLPKQRMPLTDTHVQIDWEVSKEKQIAFEDNYKSVYQEVEKRLVNYRIPLIQFDTITPIRTQVKELLNDQYRK